MISSEHLAYICDSYQLGSVLSVRKIEEGVLNHNYKVTTSKDTFFIKSVREKGVSKLPIISRVEHFMDSQQIPAISAMNTKTGEVGVMCGGATYTVYPFVESDRRHDYSLSDYENMGKMLAHIHVVTKTGIPAEFSHLITKRPSRTTIQERFARHKACISAKKQNDTDQLFLAYITLKEKAMSKLSEEHSSTQNILLHGDFHPGNLLFDANTREIIGVCDWEKAEVAPRGYELARAILYSCFDGAKDTELAIARSKALLVGYEAVFPIDKEEFVAGFKMRLERSVLSSWIEETYYERNDSRANHFIANEMKTIKLFFYEKPDLPALLRG